MCGSMADIQSETAEIRRGKNRKKKEINCNEIALTVNFHLYLIYLPFTIHVCFSGSVSLHSDWFSLLHFHFSIKKEHFSSRDHEL